MINPDAVMARKPEEVEAAIELARAAGVSEALLERMGGMATNVATAVLDVETDQPIPGLFAAGECVDGIHGAVRIGACAVMDCLVNGRQAGLSAAKNKL